MYFLDEMAHLFFSKKEALRSESVEVLIIDKYYLPEQMCARPCEMTRCSFRRSNKSACMVCFYRRFYAGYYYATNQTLNIIPR